MKTEGHFVAFKTSKGDIEVASLHEVRKDKGDASLSLHQTQFASLCIPSFTFLTKKKYSLTGTVDKYDIISVILCRWMEGD